MTTQREEVVPPNQLAYVPETGAVVTTEGGTKLVGRLHTYDLVLAALAFAGPLAATIGYISLLIGYGNGLGTPMMFLLVMGILLVFGLTYGAMTRHVDRPGAFYSYITAGLGRHVGLGSSFLILASYITIGIGFYGFAGLSMQEFVVRAGGPDIVWWVYALAFWALVGTLAYFRVDISAKVLGALLILEVIVVVVFDIVSFAGGATGISLEPFNPTEFFVGNVGFALAFAVALFTGFESTAIYREETVRPNKTIPRATIIVVLVIGLFYSITSWAFITGLGAETAVEQAAADPAGVFFVVASQYGGQILVDVASVLLISSVFAAHLAIQNVSTRYVYSLSIDGILPRALGVAHKRFGSPARASVTVSLTYLILTGALTIIGLTALEIYAWFAGLASFTLILAMVLVSISAVAYYFFGTGRNQRKTFSTTLAPILSVIGLGIVAVLVQLNFGDITGGDPLLNTVMIICSYVTFIVGIMVAEVLRRRSPAKYARIGRQ
ncbi:APC family permease [Agromyces neolithicus]|uniref:APC family permease n=1 Tax=Agromyces neolithicus TaxID=269420 RepID=A0ABP4YKP5_9MICO